MAQDSALKIQALTKAKEAGEVEVKSLQATIKFNETYTEMVKSEKLLNAISYTLKRRASLTRYAQDGSLPIDNNPVKNHSVENHIRPIAIGKKNWLFVGCPKAGQSMAAIYSLLMTAKRNGLERYAWLKNVLERLPTQRPSYCCLTYSNQLTQTRTKKASTKPSGSNLQNPKPVLDSNYEL